MKRFSGSLKKFFFPSDKASTLIRVMPLVAVAVLMVILFAFSNFAWEYTNAITFCGLTCHTMPPQYTTQQNSAHANVACEDCHMGRDALRVMIPRKVTYSWQTGSAMVTGSYTYPIVAKNMIPARTACENCHQPETFTSDKLVQIKHYAEDEQNTLSTTYLSLKIGGGTAREGLGKGIHWHIENPIYYYASDIEQQKIPYVVVTKADGTKTEYIDSESGFDPSKIKQSDLKTMDCITCHNRAAHAVSDPQTAVDQLLSRGLMSATIPTIKKKAVEVLASDYSNIQTASDAINGLDAFYQSHYPDFYATNKTLITQAVQALSKTYSDNNFPDQKFDWKTHPNNIGHLDSAGCFRCHDGKHTTRAGATVRIECNLCHTIPVVSSANQTSTIIEISNNREPDSHKNSNWISLHNTLYDNSCKECHDTRDPGGTSNTSFCSTSGCHGTKWVYAGFDAPKMRQVLAEQAKSLATPIPQP